MRSDEQIKVSEDVSTQDVINSLNIAKDLFTSVGVIGLNPCDPDGSMEKLNKMVDDFSKDLTKTLDKITFSLGGDFLLTVLILMAEVLGTTISALLVTIISQGFSKFLGFYNNFIMYILSSLKGIEMVIQYYALKFLKNLLLKRVHLSNELQGYFYFIQNFLTLLNFDTVNTSKLSKSVLFEVNKILKSIMLTLAVEYKNCIVEYSSGSVEQLKPVDVNKIRTVKSEFDKIFALLTKDESSKLTSDIALLIRELQLENELGMGDLQVLTNLDSVIKNIASGIYKKYLNVSPQEADFKIKIRQSIEKLKPILVKIDPVIGNLIMTAILYDSMSENVDNISRKVPILGGNLNILKNNVASIWKNKLSVNLKAEKYTLNSLNSSIKISEGLIVIFKSLWNEWSTLGNTQTDVLKKAIDNLKEVNKDIEESIIIEKEDFLTRMGYYYKLSSISSKINSLDQTYTVNLTSESSLTANPGLTANTIDKAKEKLKKLNNYLVNKNIDKVTKKHIPNPAEQAYVIANKNLVSLMLDIGLLFMPNERKSAIKNIHAINILLDKQKKEDLIELSYINDYINTMDSIQEFRLLRSLFENFLKDAADNNNSLASEILKGDLSSISNLMALGQTTSDLVSTMFCKDSEKETVLQSLTRPVSLPGPAVAEIEVKFADAENTLIEFKNRKVILDYLLEE